MDRWFEIIESMLVLFDIRYLINDLRKNYLDLSINFSLINTKKVIV